MSLAAIVAVLPFKRQGVRVESGATLVLPLPEAQALLDEHLAIPAGAQLEIERRPVVGRFVSRPRQ